MIDHLRRYENIQSIIDKLDLPIDSSFYFISAITKLEVLSGKSINNAKIKVEADLLLNQFQIIDIDDLIIESASKLRRKYDLKLADAIIAATTIDNNLILITRNIKHFKGISGLDFLKL